MNPTFEAKGYDYLGAEIGISKKVMQETPRGPHVARRERVFEEMVCVCIHSIRQW